MNHQSREIRVVGIQGPTVVESREFLIRKEARFIGCLVKEGYKGSGWLFRKDGMA